MNRIRRHFKMWKKWQKNNINSRFYNLLVLLGIKHSPTFIITKALEQENDRQNERGRL